MRPRSVGLSRSFHTGQGCSIDTGRPNLRTQRSRSYSHSFVCGNAKLPAKENDDGPATRTDHKAKESTAVADDAATTLDLSLNASFESVRAQMRRLDEEEQEERGQRRRSLSGRGIYIYCLSNLVQVKQGKFEKKVKYFPFNCIAIRGLTLTFFSWGNNYIKMDCWLFGHGSFIK